MFQQQHMLQESGFAQLYPDMQQFYLDQQSIHGTANKRMIEAVRSNPLVDGYCIHALAAGDWILGAGLIDIWRRPKSYAYEATRAANQPRIVSIRLASRNVYAQTGTTLDITGINDLASIQANVSVEISNGKGKTVFKRSFQKEFTSGISTLFISMLDTKKWKGTYTINVHVHDQAGNQLTHNRYTFDVFPQKSVRLQKREIALFNKNGALSDYFRVNKV